MKPETISQEKAVQVLNALEAHIAVLDSRGVILHTNKAWDSFAAHNPLLDGSPPLRVGVGTNYLTICRTAKGYSAESSLSAYRGIKEVLAGRKRQFILEYPCHGPDEQRWFVMRVTPLKGSRPKEVVITHTNITSIKQTEWAMHRKIAELASALENLESLAGSMKSSLILDRSVQTDFWNPKQENNQVTAQSGRSEIERLKLLSKRETEVLLALVRGERNVDIATRLSLSAKSVSTYRARILEKLKLANTTELISFMARTGILK